MNKLSYSRFLARAAMTLLAVFCFIGARAQIAVTIGEDTTVGNATPIGTSYNYSITEQLYTAGEIGMAGTISSISFYYVGTSAKDYPITVYMANVSATNLSTGISLADAEQVFSGTLSVTGAGWATIVLDTPFEYNGTSNLLIGVIKDNASWFSGSTWQYTSVGTMARFSQNDTNAYDTSTVPATLTTNRPNIQIVITPEGAICTRPSTFAVSDITGSSASFEWENTGAASYLLEYKKASASGWTPVPVAGVGQSANVTCSLSNLDPGTTYDVRVKAICEAGLESGYKSLSFITLFNIPLVEQFGISLPTGWTMYSGLLSNVMAGTAELANVTTGWTFGTKNGVFDNHARVNIYGTSCNYWLVTPTLAMENNVQLMFEVAYTAYSGEGSPAQNGSDDKFIVLINNGNGWTILRQWDNAGSEYVLNDLNTTPAIVALDLSSYAGQNVAIAFYGESTMGNVDNNLHIDNVSIDYIPACAMPTGLTVNYDGGTEATVSWTSDATAWNLSVNGTITPVTQNQYTLTNLDLATTYEVKVQAVCSETETSEWTNPVSFTTDLSDDMCAVNITLTDAYGDGGGQIQVVDDLTNEVLGTYTCSGASNSYTLRVANGRKINFIFASTDSWAYENGWIITDINDDIIAEREGCSSSSSCDAPVNGIIATYTVNCTISDCKKPTNLAASEIGPRSAVLSWTENGEAEAWIICVNGDMENLIEAATNPFTLTGLDPETSYTVKVTPLCEIEKWSDEFTFTTDVTAPAPTNLVANRVNATSATLNWEGVGNEYNVRYGQLMTDVDNVDPTTPATVILTAPDVWGDGSGYQMLLDADATAYGNIIPETDGLTSEGDVSAEIYDEFEYKIPRNADGALTTSNIVFNNSIAIEIPAGTYDWCITNPTRGDRMWIASSNGNVPGRYDDFVFKPGMTYEFTISAYGSSDGVSLTTTAPVDWITVEGVTNPYQLTDLTPSTDYYWQVQVNCGEDGTSQWSATASFTTGSVSDAPTELAATDITSSTATLEWTGSQESYNVRYKVKVSGEVLAEHNFDESSLGEWTTIDADGDGYDWILATQAAGVYHNAGVDLSGQGHNDSNDFLISGSYSNTQGVGALYPDNYLVSPKVALGGSISFYAQAQDESFPAEHFGVAVSTAGNTDAADFTTIEEWTLNADGTGSKAGTWGLFTVDLSAYAGQEGYVAIRHFNCTDQFIINIDDIVIEGPAQTETEWITLENISDNSIGIEELDSKTAYIWQVQGILDEGTTAWVSGDSFTTLPLVELANDCTENSDTISLYADQIVDVKLTGRTLFKDNSWNTICLPFDIRLEGSPLEGATAKELALAEINGTHVKLTFDFVDNLKAGVPYIIKWEEEAEALSEPTFTGVTIKKVPATTHTISLADDNVKFIGYYNAFDITSANQNIYYMTANNTLKYTGVDRTLKACRAYFQFTEAAIGRQLILDFGDGETTGIADLDMNVTNGNWYTVDGKKLDKKPTRKGVYINNGVKIVIK